MSTKDNPIDLLNPPSYFPILLLVVGIIGVFISLIVFDIRLDATLYAQSVNGIRKYFLEKERTKQSCLKDGRQTFDPSPYVVLPTDISKPSLTKLTLNGWIFILMFLIINSLYICFGTDRIISHWQTMPRVLSVGSIGILLVAIHPCMYWAIGKHKETHYGQTTQK